MNNDDTLAALAVQAAGAGADLPTLRALIEEASHLGAGRALGHLGLADDHAQKDMNELRELFRPGAMPKHRRARRQSAGWCEFASLCC